MKQAMCSKCGSVEPVNKMWVLLCPKCRVILFYKGTEEYKKRSEAK